ncbi:hypothetical protein [Arenibaculum sp.]|jgi:hypothetical protein|uniref:hypothetical protein n=1 Tax=Arenibaculum sp. TaxID=2865862 RepID=UPI002E0D7B8C|nr:hypothetical protein [Arenibaculum sp.]
MSGVPVEDLLGPWSSELRSVNWRERVLQPTYSGQSNGRVSSAVAGAALLAGFNPRPAHLAGMRNEV